MTLETRKLLRALVQSVVGDREDQRVTAPVLKTMLVVAISDFERYHSRHQQAARIHDHDLLMARNKAASQTRGET